MKEKEQISRQQQKSRETKEKIFKAAKRILQKGGYEELSIKNICEEAGVSNGSFYHHFKTKDDLLSYYIEDQPQIEPNLLELPDSVQAVKDGIIQVYLNYVKYCRELGVEFISVVLGVLSIIILLTLCIVSGHAKGRAGMEIGALGLATMVLSIIGFVLAVR